MIFLASRLIPASPSQVFAAFADRDCLARWWGPAGFTSTFHVYEFEPGGKWSFVMQGPDGKSYPNEIVVTEIASPHRLALHHVSAPQYRLSVLLGPTVDGGTLVTWRQEFENAETGRRLAQIVTAANEELLERLAIAVLNRSVGE